MNRPFHLARKDARRLGPALGLWLALFPLPAALLVAHATGRVNSFAPGVLGAVHQVLCVAGFMLAVQLALEDPLHHPDAGWRTRPIRLRDLLLAKLGLACAALVVAPTALLILVWTAAGFTPRDIAALAFDQTAIHTLLAGFGLLLGALTRDLGQALLGLAGTLAALLTIFLSIRERALDIAGGLLASACVALMLALFIAYRPRVPRMLTAGLGFIAATLVATALRFHEPAPRPVVASAGPASPLVVGSQARLGSEQLRLVRMEPSPRNVAPFPPMLWLEWRRLAPHRSLLSRETHVMPELLVLSGFPQPISSYARSLQVAGLRFTSQEASLPDTGYEGTTWRPAAPSTSAPTP